MFHYNFNFSNIFGQNVDSGSYSISLRDLNKVKLTLEKMSPLFATLGEAKARALLHRGVEGVEEVRCGGTGDRESRGAIFIASKCRRFFSSIISSCLRLLLLAWFSFSNNFMHFVKNSKTLFEPTWNSKSIWSNQSSK